MKKNKGERRAEPCTNAPGSDVPSQPGPPSPTPAGDYQNRDAKGELVPLPVYQLVPCFDCVTFFASGFGDAAVKPCEECDETRYVRRDPEKHPIAREHRVQETKA